MDSSIPEQSADPAAAGTAVCNACKQDLDEVRDESVVSFGKHLFHVNCFRCAKCRCLVEHNTNLLLLSDGSPVCENCSYMCTICQKPIHNEAIVTGDESYHADCFRCRSCSNKIEELIFAKTNQGIWCMACHNERVARTRRHAEAKRRARKDRESRGGRKSQPDSETAPAQLNAYDSSSVSRDTSSPPTPARTPEPVQATSRHSPAPVRPLPPHPGDPSSMPSEGRSDVVTAPTDSIAMLARSGMPSLPPCVPSPTLRPQAGASAPQPAPTGTRTDAASPVPVTSAAAAQLPHLSVTADVFIDTFDDTDAADRALDGGSTLGLTAPTAGSKAHNRRSGFYGAMARPVPPPAGSNDAEGDVDFDVPSTRQTASPRRPSRDILTPQMATPVEAPQSQQYSTADLAHSTSFYDPDTLLFLTHVTSSSPGSPFHSGATSTTTGYPAVAPVSDQEQLDTLDSPRDPTAPDERADTASSKPSETARRVRESLQMSQQESVRSSLAELDVELVETLLAELDATQREIKEIKTRYNAFRRASRSAFEGFSMAREEYDKEVAARREVERQMASLRARFAEQARRLAQVDQEQATTEELKRRSKTLRTSVVGMEKHLSQLRAELALSTAQAAELVALDGSRGPQDGSPDGRALAPSSQAEMAEGLNQRLEAVKESHRAEISTLVAERDDLLREIEELKRMRDAHAAEAELLASRNAELSRLNETAARNLDDLRGPLSKVSTSSDRLGEGRGHVSTMSASSAATLFSPPPTRPTGSAARSGAVTIAEAQPAYRPTTAETASRNKFWSKNKLKNDPSKQSTSQAGVASPPPDKSPGPSMRGAAAAAEPSTRSHLFQPSSILRPVRCDYCGDKMWGLNEVRCSACGSYAHAKCAGFLQTSCSPGGVSPTVAQPAEDYGPPILASGSMFGAELAVQAEKEGGNVPAVVLKCIEVVEEGGMSYEGIYRKTGGMGQTKLITQNFERGQDFDLSDRDKFNDIAAVTSCLKNYFRSLPVPLMTHDLHEDFISATEISDPNGRLDAIALVLQRLPRTHYETARHLFLHLNRVQARAAENKMTAANLGVVFGPTVLRSPVAAREWSDMGPKTKLVEILCEHAERLFSPTRAHI